MEIKLDNTFIRIEKDKNIHEMKIYYVPQEEFEIILKDYDLKAYERAGAEWIELLANVTIFKR